MSDSQETLKQLSDRELLLKLFERFDTLEKRFDQVESRMDANDVQFEEIRKGITHNYVILERVQGDIHHLRADVHEMGEEVRKDKLALK